LKQFRAGFSGKCSPVHFFWGGFDLAVTRFSGRPAPEHPGGVPHLPDRVAREAYSHEVSSCGFWPGNEMLPEAAFYAYAYPEPEGFGDAGIALPGYYHRDLREFILPYDGVREAASPDGLVLDFLQRTYEAAATLGRWAARPEGAGRATARLAGRRLGRKRRPRRGDCYDPLFDEDDLRFGTLPPARRASDRP